VKIKGPGGPTTPPDIDEPGESAESGKARGPKFAERLHDPAKVGGPSGPGGPGAADPIAAIGADLKAGRITPAEAAARVIDLAVKGPAGALPAKVQAQLRADLERLAGEDPFLRSKLEKLGVPPRDDDA